MKSNLGQKKEKSKVFIFFFGKDEQSNYIMFVIYLAVIFAIIRYFIGLPQISPSSLAASISWALLFIFIFRIFVDFFIKILKKIVIKNKIRLFIEGHKKLIKIISYAVILFFCLYILFIFLFPKIIVVRNLNKAFLYIQTDQCQKFSDYVIKYEANPPSDWESKKLNYFLINSASAMRPISSRGPGYAKSSEDLSDFCSDYGGTITKIDILNYDHNFFSLDAIVQVRFHGNNNKTAIINLRNYIYRWKIKDLCVKQEKSSDKCFNKWYNGVSDEWERWWRSLSIKQQEDWVSQRELY